MQPVRSYIQFSKFASAALVVVLLGGCATFTQDGGFGTVATFAKERLNKEVQQTRSNTDGDRLQATLAQRLQEPLAVDNAVQIALLNNRGLQAIYGELGIAEADLVQAGRWRNPRFGYVNARGDGALSIDKTLGFDFLQLLTIPLATKIETRRFEQTKLLVANEVLRVAAETRKAWYEAVGAGQSVHYMEQVKTAAQAGAQLAQELARAGNWSVLDQAREQAFYADATAQLARARQTAIVEREKLTRLMGLFGKDTAFKLPDLLPDLPAARPSLQELEAFAIAQRLDLQAAKLQTQGLASSLGLTKATRFVNVLELGPTQLRDPGEIKSGYEISLEVPLFDWGGARLARAESVYMQSVNRLAATAVNARSEVRESYSSYLTAYDLAKHYRDEVVPLRKKISDELLLRYNGMLVSVFELLADSREQVAAVNTSIEALKSYWLAETELQIALGGKLPPMAAANGGAGAKAPAPGKSTNSSEPHSDHQKGN